MWRDGLIIKMNIDTGGWLYNWTIDLSIQSGQTVREDPLTKVYMAVYSLQHFLIHKTVG